MNAGRVYTHTVRRGEADTPLLTLLTTNYSHSSALEWVDHISNKASNMSSLALLMMLLFVLLVPYF